MTKVIETTNVNTALLAGIKLLHLHGSESRSRNGAVLVSPEPVITEYMKPNERVLFSAVRDANPFFHLMESLWMLAGRNDVRFPAYYAANIATFSDDGVTIAGAYGERWRWRFGYDQLLIIINELKSNPDTRRCVLSMWDAEYNPIDETVPVYATTGDLHLAMTGGKDVPCNTQIYFDMLGGKLNMTVTCRSNDIIWGCYGANAVHFSILHEYVALCSGREQGVYRQFSNNYHAYSERPDTVKLFNTTPSEICDNRYTSVECTSFPLISTSAETWEADMQEFFASWKEGQIMTGVIYAEPFWRFVVIPMVNAHHLYKAKEYDLALEEIKACAASDWRIAATEWLQRRKEKNNA